MTDNMIWVVLIISTIGTFLLRYSFLWLNDKIQFSDTAAEWLKLIPATAIVALIVPALMASPSVLEGDGGPKLCSSIVAILIMWKTRSSTFTLIIGMATLWFIRWLT
ncbi:AzlD domain-containing protein [Vibrio sp. 10N.222.49.A3]|uniref:AzlD domain-containing protein n=1 Tax=Vibrio sp. 10N.222.49.A3 TaxID=3229611 RepID=UPI003550E8A1